MVNSTFASNHFLPLHVCIHMYILKDLLMWLYTLSPENILNKVIKYQKSFTLQQLLNTLNQALRNISIHRFFLIISASHWCSNSTILPILLRLCFNNHLLVCSLFFFLCNVLINFNNYFSEFIDSYKEC